MMLRPTTAIPSTSVISSETLAMLQTRFEMGVLLLLTESVLVPLLLIDLLPSPDSFRDFFVSSVKEVQFSVLAAIALLTPE